MTINPISEKKRWQYHRPEGWGDCASCVHWGCLKFAVALPSAVKQQRLSRKALTLRNRPLISEERKSNSFKLTRNFVYFINYSSSVLFLGKFTDLAERFEKRRKSIDFIINPVTGFLFLNNPEI